MAIDYIPVKEVPIEMNITSQKLFSVFCFHTMAKQLTMK